MLQNILIFQLIQNPISRYCNYYIIQYPYISIFLWDASERCPPGPSLGRRTWVANAGHHYSIIPFSSSLSVKIETLSKPSPKSTLDKSSRQYKLSAYHTWNCGIRGLAPCLDLDSNYCIQWCRRWKKTTLFVQPLQPPQLHIGANTTSEAKVGHIPTLPKR